MNKIALFNTVLIALILFSSQSMIAQENGKDDLSNSNVTVTTTYTPVISDAFRMESLPVIQDTISVNPKFSYSIISKLLPTTLHPTPLRAAQLKGQPKEYLDKGYAKLGIGSKFTLDADIYYMNTRKSDLNWGVIGGHTSAQGKLKNPIDQRVYAGYSKNNIGAYIKKMYSKLNVWGNLNFYSSQYFFYGYNPVNINTETILPEQREDFIKGNYRQRYSDLSLKTRIKSTYAQKKKINYDIRFNYDFWFDVNKNREHSIDINADLSKNIRKELLGVNTGLFIMPASYLSTPTVLFNITPYVKHNNKNFKLKLGLKTTVYAAGDSTKYHFYPDVYIEHNIADVILPYASFSGNLLNHSMLNLTDVNPFVNDTLRVRPENIKQNLCVGIKGRISDEVQFNINGQYNKINNQHFFVTDLHSPLKNRFNVVYSDAELFKAYAELDFDFRKFELRLHGMYGHYSWLEDVDKAWHIPAFRSGLFAAYQVFPQLKVHFEAFFESKRYAGLDINDNNTWTSIEMKPVIDINLGANYMISSQLSAFVQLNNLAGQNYEIWYQYPVYGFHGMGGIKYSF